MKKLLVGCLAIAVLGVVLLAAGGYFLYRAASPMIQSARDFAAGLAEMGDIDREIKNTSAYAAPASNELTPAQVERFVRVQESVRKALGDRMKEIDEKYKRFNVEEGGNQTAPSITEAISALKDMANVFVQARRFQVNALNQEGFSQAEYSWVRDRVFQAAGVELGSHIDITKIEEAVRNGTGIQDIEAPDLPKPDVPAKNRELVKPHADKMGEWLPLAFFGM